MGQPVKHGNNWRIRWTDEIGVRRSETYEQREIAEVMLKQHEQHVREIRLGMRTGIVPDRSYGDLCDLWLAEYAPTKRSQKDIESILRVHLRPFFGRLPLKQICRLHVRGYIKSRQHLSPKTIDNHLILLRSMLREAVEIGWLEKAPRIKVAKKHRDQNIYRYLKTKAEIRRFLHSAREEGELVWLLYKLTTYTGMRAGEVAGLRWEDIDFDTNIITVQRSYDGPTKNEIIRRIPVFDVVRSDLSAWALKAQRMPVVFPNQRGRMHGPSARVFQEVLHRVLDRAEFPTVEIRGKQRSYITFHGLRHTFASHWMMRAGNLFKLQRLLGHKTIEMTQRYSHLAPDAFSGDLGRFGQAAGDLGELVTLPVADGGTSAHR